MLSFDATILFLCWKYNHINKYVAFCLPLCYRENVSYFVVCNNRCRVCRVQFAIHFLMSNIYIKVY